jgi:hypothetical protein
MALCLANITFKQVRIPLNNEIGVPFFKDQNDYYVDGFDIDINGNLYFLGGENAILTCFAGENIVFHKKYTEFKSNQINLLGDNIYLFDYKFEKNNLFKLNRENGDIISRYDYIVINRVNAFLFKDTNLIVELFNYQEKIDLATERGFILLSLKGKFLKQVNNLYNLPDNLNPKNREVQFLGRWDDNYVYWNYDLDIRFYEFILRNNTGDIIATQRIDEKIFGKPFYGSPIEHKKLRNDKIYVLGHDEHDAIITEMQLKELFN